jgi:hypothetical protein
VKLPQFHRAVSNSHQSDNNTYEIIIEDEEETSNMPLSGVSSSSMGEVDGGVNKERDEKREVLDSFRTDSSFNEDEHDYDILNTLSPEVHYDKSPKK